MHKRVVSGKLAGLVVAAMILLCVAASALAQGKPVGAGPPPNNNPNLDDRIRQIDESRLRSAEVDAGTEERNQKLVQAAIVNMKEDYKRIQVLRNDIARRLQAHSGAAQRHRAKSRRAQTNRI